MSKTNPLIRFPLAAAMLAAMGSVSTGRGTSSDEAVDSSIVQRCSVPEHALDAIMREAGGLDFGPVTAERTETGTVYAADIVRNGHATGVKVDGEGNLRATLTEIEVWELPVAVKRVADAETLGFPARSFVIRATPNETVYLVDAATGMRGKRLEIDPQGNILNKELKLG